MLTNTLVIPSLTMMRKAVPCWCSICLSMAHFELNLTVEFCKSVTATFARRKSIPRNRSFKHLGSPTKVLMCVNRLILIHAMHLPTGLTRWPSAGQSKVSVSSSVTRRKSYLLQNGLQQCRSTQSFCGHRFAQTRRMLRVGWCSYRSPSGPLHLTLVIVAVEAFHKC